MSNRRRVVLVGLAVFLGFTLYHALSPWGWSGQTVPPAGVAVQTVSYTCGAPWGSSYVHGPTSTAYPLTGKPCGQRGTYQLMTAVDVLLGVFALATVAGWRKVRMFRSLT